MAVDSKRFHASSVVFREGDPSDCIYIVTKGVVSIRKRKGTRYVELGRAYTNEVIGELAFFSRLPRSATAVALTEVEMLSIPFEALDKIYAGIPSYWKAIFQAVASRLTDSNKKVAELQKGRFDTTEYAEESSTEASPSSAGGSLEEVLSEAQQIEKPKNPQKK